MAVQEDGGLLNHALMLLIAFIAALAAGWIIYKRSRSDADVSELISLIRDMEMKGCEYWTIREAHPRSKNLAVEIKRLSKHIGEELTRLNKESRRKKRFNFLLLTRFRQAVTNGQFEQIDREADERRVERISNECRLLIASVRKI